MWMSVVAATLLGLSAGQTGKLTVNNDRLTYGHLGPTREVAKYLPGDAIHLLFEVEGIGFDANGKASYTIALEILDPRGSELLKQKPRNASAQNYLGGSTLPCAANLQIPLESPPGLYTFRVAVVDSATKKSAVVERKFEVLPKQFGVVLVGTSADREGTIAWSPVGVVGDSIYFNFTAVGFVRDKKTKQPHIKVELHVRDDKGNVVKGAKMHGAANSDVPADLQAVPMQFGITLNRAGRFTLELTATDALAGKTVTVQFPVRVVAP
jgi:hypothetical protein